MMFLGIVRRMSTRISIAAALALALSLLAGCGGGSPGNPGVGDPGGGSGTGTVIGRVVDTTPVPIPVNQATVKCAGVTAFTGPDGRFTLLNVPTGWQSITVTPPSGSSLTPKSTSQFLIQPNTTTNVNDVVLQDSGPPGPPPG
jgi:hypothetical protein